MTEITSPSSHGYCFASVPQRIALYFQIWTQKYSEAWMNFLLILSFLIYIEEATELSELF